MNHGHFKQPDMDFNVFLLAMRHREVPCVFPGNSEAIRINQDPAFTAGAWITQI